VKREIQRYREEDDDDSLVKSLAAAFQYMRNMASGVPRSRAEMELAVRGVRWATGAAGTACAGGKGGSCQENSSKLQYSTVFLTTAVSARCTDIPSFPQLGKNDGPEDVSRVASLDQSQHSHSTVTAQSLSSQHDKHSRRGRAGHSIGLQVDHSEKTTRLCGWVGGSRKSRERP